VRERAGERERERERETKSIKLARAPAGFERVNVSSLLDVVCTKCQRIYSSQQLLRAFLAAQLHEVQKKNVSSLLDLVCKKTIKLTRAPATHICTNDFCGAGAKEAFGM